MSAVDENKTQSIQEVAENIFKFRLPMPFKLDHVNVYLLRDNNRLAMVDTGLPNTASWQALNACMDALGLALADLTDIFVTHSHPDHMGQLERIRQAAPAARFYMHQRELDLLQQRVANPQEAEQRMQAWLSENGADELIAANMGGRGIKVPEIGPRDAALQGGEKISLSDPAAPTDAKYGEWQVMWTPGHTAGHFVIYNSARQLMLSGDHLLGQISSNIGKYPGSTADPLGDYLNSLDKIAGLDLQQVLPAHGMPFSDYKTRAATLREHHRERLEKMYAAVDAAQPVTAAQVVQKIWPHRRLEDFDRFLALFETLSHLERLVLEQKVNRIHQGGQTLYQAI